MIQRMKQEKKINIFDLVKQLRSQRTKSVQTLDQYDFLYTSAVELTESRKQQPQGEITKENHVEKY
jgi:protein tyrosine phosphatase